MRRAARKDTTHAPIVEALRKAGASVSVIESVNERGLPDLLVGFRGRTFLLEAKTPRSKKGTVTMKPGQAEWHAAWRGSPVCIVRNAEEALAVLEGKHP